MRNTNMRARTKGWDLVGKPILFRLDGNNMKQLQLGPNLHSSSNEPGLDLDNLRSCGDGQYGWFEAWFELLGSSSVLHVRPL